jgi:hypothetical protein
MVYTGCYGSVQAEGFIEKLVEALFHGVVW